MTQTIRLASDRQRQLARDLILRAPDNAIVSIKPETRSGEANSKLWALLSDVSRAKPQGRTLAPELWKCLFMAAIGEKIRFEPDLDGEGVVPMGYRSSRLPKAKFSELIECIYAYGAEHGIAWSEPNPYNP